MTSHKIIVCAVDLSEGCEYAITRAGSLAKQLGCVLELLHVYRPPVLALPHGRLTGSLSHVANLSRSAQTQLDTYRDQLMARGVESGVCMLEGPIAASIVERARKLQALMLVLGTHGRSGLNHMWLGSIAERVARTATVPVLSVRHAQPELWAAAGATSRQES